MATYAVGDIQGCFGSLSRLLEVIRFNPAHDRLWLVGDLVNRGPDSLAVLRWAVQHEAALEVVLGNHDLHALAVAENVAPMHRSDRLQALLDAPDAPVLLDWLRHRRMAHAEGPYLMVHAGVLPAWDAAQVMALAAEVESALHGAQYRNFLAAMYGNLPDGWQDALQGMERLRVITNAMTRLRVCTPAGAMEFRFKGKPIDAPTGYLPWFEVPGRRSASATVVCGHWSALGLVLRENLIALDTGCLWGGALSAVRLQDLRVFQVPCDAADAVAQPWHA